MTKKVIDIERATQRIKAEEAYRARDLNQALTAFRQAGDLLGIARCMAEQGRFKAAFEALNVKLKGLDQQCEIELFRDYLTFHLAGDPYPLVRRVKRATKREVPSITLAFAYDLLGRVLLVSRGWKLIGVQAQNEIAQAFIISAQHYRLVLRFEEALRSEMHLAQFYQRIEGQNGKALKLLKELSERQENAAQALLLRQAQAELELSLALQGKDSAALLRIEHVLHEIGREVEATMHETAKAESMLAQSRCLLDNGRDPGKLPWEALQVFERNGSLLGAFEAATQIATLQLMRGELAKSFEVRAAALHLARNMGFAVGEVSSHLALVELAAREGRYHVREERALLERAASVPLTSAPVFTAVASLNHVLGNDNQADKIAGEAVTLASRCKSKELMAQASLMAATIKAARKSFEGARGLLKQSIANGRGGDSLVAQAEKEQLMAQIEVQEGLQKKAKDLPAIVRRAEKRCISMMRKLPPAQDGMENPEVLHARGLLFQALGQIALFNGQNLEALQRVGLARAAFAEGGLRLQLAHTDAMLGLICRSLANLGHAGLEAEAQWHFAQARESFAVVCMPAMQESVRAMEERIKPSAAAEMASKYQM